MTGVVTARKRRWGGVGSAAFCGTLSSFRSLETVCFVILVLCTIVALLYVTDYAAWLGAGEG